MDAGFAKFGEGIARGTIGGTVVTDGTAVRFTIGFMPKCIKIVNATDVVVWEKLADMPASTALKNAAGDMTIDTSGAIVIDERGFTLSAEAAGTAKTLYWFTD
jgi:hypothetical protein